MRAGVAQPPQDKAPGRMMPRPASLAVRAPSRGLHPARWSGQDARGRCAGAPLDAWGDSPAHFAAPVRVRTFPDALAWQG